MNKVVFLLTNGQTLETQMGRDEADEIIIAIKRQTPEKMVWPVSIDEENTTEWLVLRHVVTVTVYDA